MSNTQTLDAAATRKLIKDTGVKANLPQFGRRLYIEVPDKRQSIVVQRVVTGESSRRVPAYAVRVDTWAYPRCNRCGADKPVGQSCGCFDNGGQ